MADKPHENEDIQLLSQKMESITTADLNKNVNGQDQPRHSRRLSNVNNSSGLRQSHKRYSMNVQVGLNLPEKIVIIVDNGREKDYTPFELGSGTKLSPLTMVKRSIEVFVNAKSTINSSHEYALMILDNGIVKWVCDWTSNLKQFITSLHKIPEVTVDDDVPFDLSDCFKEILNKVETLDVLKNPTCICRAILIYSRSHSKPSWSDPSDFERLKDNSFFFLDSVYVHEPAIDNDCEEIYAELNELDRGDSYIFEVQRNSARIHSIMGELLAHPLQRVKQAETDYDLQPSSDTGTIV